MASWSRPQHAPRGVVDVLEAALLVDDQHAFDHAREDRDHARAIARELVDAPPELLHGLSIARATSPSSSSP